MRRRRYIFVSPRVLPRSGLLPGVCADMVFVPRRGSLRRTCIPLVYAEMPSGQQVMVAPRPWVGTTPWYQPTANEDIAPPAHQMPSGAYLQTVVGGHPGMPRQADPEASLEATGSTC